MGRAVTSGFVAAVDIGSNSVRLVHARATGSGASYTLDVGRTTRLGLGVSRTGRMGAEGLGATARALSEFASLSVGASARGAVLTEAARSAANVSEVLTAARGTGWPSRTISAEEEADLVIEGIGPGLEGAEFVIDLGGGSTEVIRARDEPVGLVASLKVGAVTMFESVGSPSDPPCAADLETWRVAALEAVGPLTALGSPASRGGRPPVVVLVGGSAAALGAFALGLDGFDAAALEGAVLDAGRLRLAVADLARLPRASRERGPIGSDRADIVVPGGILLLEVLERVGAAAVRLSTRGLRHGLALRLLRGDWLISGGGSVDSS